MFNKSNVIKAIQSVVLFSAFVAAAPIVCFSGWAQAAATDPAGACTPSGNANKSGPADGTSKCVALQSCVAELKAIITGKDKPSPPLDPANDSALKNLITAIDGVLPCDPSLGDVAQCRVKKLVAELQELKDSNKLDSSNIADFNQQIGSLLDGKFPKAPKPLAGFLQSVMGSVTSHTRDATSAGDVAKNLTAIADLIDKVATPDGSVAAAVCIAKTTGSGSPASTKPPGGSTTPRQRPEGARNLWTTRISRHLRG